MSEEARAELGSRPECHSCGYPAEDIETVKVSVFHDPADMCGICRSTLLGNIYTYGHYHGDAKALAQSIGYIGNLLLEELRASAARQAARDQLDADRWAELLRRVR